MFLTDFTPTGAFIADGPGASANLAALQWLAFVAPSVLHARDRGWSLRDTFRLRPCSWHWLAAGAAGGVALWAAVNATLAAKAGTGAAWVPSGAGSGADGQLLAASLSAAGSSPAAAATLIATTALSPAVAEELLFRGLLLTALGRRLGRVDAVAVCGALFALIHLAPDKFFPLAVLGFGAGGVADGSRSVAPAVALHFSYNLTALAVGWWVLAGS